METIEKHDGKTVLKITKGETYVEIEFTDGSKLEISAKGSEISWISIYEQDY
jgi:hypothetical protein